MSEKIKSSVSGKSYRNPLIMKRLIAVIIALVGIIVIMLIFMASFIWSRNDVSTSTPGNNTANTTKTEKKTTSSNVDTSKVIAASESNGNIGDHVRGKADSKVVFVEYADMQCPGCASMTSVVESLYSEYKDRVAFVFRHYTISGHDLAGPAAIAIEAAGRQGYFWQSVMYLFGVRSSWIYEDEQTIKDLLTSYLASSYPDFNVDQFYQDVQKDELAQKVAFDTQIGKQIDGLSATPSFFLNGKAIEFSGSKKLSEVKELLKSELDAALAE